ncbi:uncharacterized protein LOC130796437 [Actinidia eriantha]|uniref:uncharacterized protein LOC130796437 n=1 Tax=Actinidia eriantha TaxID=165200 RepID=UPI00258A1CF1|nr:uncharacterized protein LOC130796437 [Actinidia eriantha]
MSQSPKLIPPSLSSKEKDIVESVNEKRKLPTAQELVGHYEAQGLDTKEASAKVIEDLQNALFRVVTSNRKKKDLEAKFMAETSRKLDVIYSRLVHLDMKLDSKPGYGGALTIGVASAGFGSIFPSHVAPAFANIWNAVRSATGPRS